MENSEFRQLIMDLGGQISTKQPNAIFILYPHAWYHINIENGIIHVHNPIELRHYASICLQPPENGINDALLELQSLQLTKDQLILLTKFCAILYETFPDNIETQIANFLTKGKKGENVIPRPTKMLLDYLLTEINFDKSRLTLADITSYLESFNLQIVEPPPTSKVIPLLPKNHPPLVKDWEDITIEFNTKKLRNPRISSEVHFIHHLLEILYGNGILQELLLSCPLIQLFRFKIQNKNEDQLMYF